MTECQTCKGLGYISCCCHASIKGSIEDTVVGCSQCGEETEKTYCEECNGEGTISQLTDDLLWQIRPILNAYGIT